MYVVEAWDGYLWFDEAEGDREDLVRGMKRLLALDHTESRCA